MIAGQMVADKLREQGGLKQGLEVFHQWLEGEGMDEPEPDLSHIFPDESHGEAMNPEHV
jgi:hypothetical protein